MNENPTVEVNKLQPITKFIYTLGVLPTSYLMSMTFQEQLTWLCNYLAQTVIPAINDDVEAIQELQQLYEDLQDYVNNYFDDLNVQEAINEKLDKMAQDGSLYGIIKQYTDPIVESQNNEIESFKTTVNNTLDEFNNKVNSLSNGSPLVANTLSDMIDTTRTYVLTSDGNWYYYDGNEWTSGGTYQTSGIGENEVKLANLETRLQKQIFPFEMNKSEYTITGQFYSGNVGSTIGTTELNNWWSGSMDVNPGDTLIIPYFPKGFTYGTVYPLLLTDEDDKIVARYDYTTISNTLVNDLEPFTLEIPSNVVKVYFNNNGSPSYNQRWYPFTFKSYNYNDVRLTNYLGNLSTLDYSDVLTGKIYSLQNWSTDLAGFKTTVYDVNPLDKINVTTTVPGNHLYVPAIYVDENLEPVGYIMIYGTSGSATEVTVDDIVPANAKHVYCCTASAINPVVKKYMISDVELSEFKKMSVSYSDGTLTITNNSNDNNLIFRNFGGNNLFMIYGYTVGNTTKYTSTDMIPAPYIVRAVNNIDGDKESSIFTGGNHQWNNSSSGSTATARQVSLSILCDDVQLNANTTLSCNNVKIVETNRVQGWNTCKEDGTGREILEEKIIFDFDGKTLNVMNTITPLEEIVIERYYGIQTALFTNSEYKIFSDKIYNVNTQSQVTKKPDVIFGGSIISSRLENAGLGDYRYNQSNVKVNVSSSKSYYAPVYNNTTAFTTDDINYIIGSYVFDDNQC